MSIATTVLDRTQVEGIVSSNLQRINEGNEGQQLVDEQSQQNATQRSVQSCDDKLVLLEQEHIEAQRTVRRTSAEIARIVREKNVLVRTTAYKRKAREEIYDRVLEIVKIARRTNESVTALLESKDADMEETVERTIREIQEGIELQLGETESHTAVPALLPPTPST